MAKKCFLRINDKVLAAVLGQEEFQSMDELRTAFEALALKQAAVPVRVDNKYTKVVRVSRQDDKIRLEIPFPSRERLDRLTFMRGNESVPFKEYGTLLPDNKVVEFDSVDSFIAFYLGGFHKIGNLIDRAETHRGMAVNDRLVDLETAINKFFSEVIKDSKRPVETSMVSPAAVDGDFIASLIELYETTLKSYGGLLKEERFEQALQFMLFAGQRLADISQEYRDKFREREIARTQKANEQAHGKGKDSGPSDPPIFFSSYDSVDGLLINNPISLGRRGLVIALRQVAETEGLDNYRVRMVEGSEDFAQTNYFDKATGEEKVMPREWANKGVVGVVEKLEGGEWKPVFLKKGFSPTLEAAGQTPDLTTDPAEAFTFDYALQEGTEQLAKTSPRIYFQLKNNSPIKADYAASADKSRFIFKIKTAQWHVPKNFQVRKMSDRPTIQEFFQGQFRKEWLAIERQGENRGRPILYGPDGLWRTVDKMELTPEEVNALVDLLAFDYSSDPSVMEDVIGYIETLIGKNSFDLKIDGNRISLAGQRWKVGEAFSKMPEEEQGAFPVVSLSDREKAFNILSAARVRVVIQGKPPVPLYSWNKFEIVNGTLVKTLVKEDEALDFYITHLSTPMRMNQGKLYMVDTELKVFPFPAPLTKNQSQSYMIQGLKVEKDKIYTAGEISQLAFSSLQDDPSKSLWYNLTQNAGLTVPKFTFVSHDVFVKEGYERSLGFYKEGTVYLSFDYFQAKFKLQTQLLDVATEELVHHLTLKKLAEESPEVDELNRLFGKLQRYLQTPEYKAYFDKLDSTSQKIVTHHTDSLVEMVGGLGRAEFRHLLRQIPSDDTFLERVLEQIKNLVKKILRLNELEGTMLEEVSAAVMDLVYSDQLAADKKKAQAPVHFASEINTEEGPAIYPVEKKKTSFKKPKAPSAPVLGLSAEMVKTLDSDAAHYLFESGAFADFVSDQIYTSTFLEELGDHFISELKQLDPESPRAKYLQENLSTRELQAQTFTEWIRRSKLFASANATITISEDDIETQTDEEGILNDSNEGGDKYFDRTESKLSSFQDGDKYIRSFVRMTPRILRNADGTPQIFDSGDYKVGEVWWRVQRDEQGAQKLSDYTSLWNRLADVLKNTTEFSEMMARLSDYRLQQLLPEVVVIKHRLETFPLDSTHVILVNKFQRSFAKALNQTLITSVRDGEGFLMEEGKNDRKRLENEINFQFSRIAEEKGWQGEGLIDPAEVLKSVKTKELDAPSVKIRKLQSLGFKFHPLLLEDSEFIPVLNEFHTALVKLLDERSGKLLIENGDLMSFLRHTKTYEINERPYVASGISTYLSNFLDYVARYSEVAVSNMTQNAQGENQSNLHTHSSFTQTIKIINDSLLTSPDKDPLFQARTRVPRLNNPLARYSLVLRNVTPQNTLEPINLSGLRETIEEETEGVNAINLDPLRYLQFELYNVLLHGVKENMRAETANSSFGFRLKSGWGNKNRHPVKPESFKEGIPERALQILRAYFRGEVERILLEHGSPYAYAGRYDAGKTRFGLFRAILGAVGTEWETELAELAQGDLSNIDKVAGGFVESREGLNDLIADYFDEELDNLKEQILLETGLDVNEDNPVLNIKQVHDLVTKIGTDETLLAFLVNCFVLSVEESILFHGELGMFDKFYKRSKSNISTGSPITPNTFTQDYLHAKKHYTFTHALTGQEPVYHREEVYNSFTMADDILRRGTSPAYDKVLDQRKEDFIESLRLYNEASGITGGDLEAQATEALRKYEEEINVTDGGAFVHPDFYRMTLMYAGSWTPAQEEGYSYLVLKFREDGGQTLTPEENSFLNYVEGRLETEGQYFNFPPVKFQYRGGGQSLEGRGVVAEEVLDKFALTPLFPEMVKGKPAAEALLSSLTEFGIGYTKFKSGTKLSSFGQDDLLTAIRAGDVVAMTSEHVLRLEFLKEQVKTSDEIKSTNPLGVQVRKLLISNLKKDGQYINAEINELVGKWKGAQRNLAEKARKELFEELGAEDVNKPEIDLAKFARLLRREASKRDLPESLTQLFEAWEEGRRFEESLSPQLVETLLYALLKNRIVRQKMPGSQLIQVPSSVFDEDVQNRDLKFYRMENGKVLKAECKVALIGDFKHLLNLPEIAPFAELNKISKFEALNWLLKDDDFVERYEKQLTIVSYRIPTQGYNSMDVLLIREFLPAYLGPTYILPPEITVKSGTDYDYDKGSVILPQIDAQGRTMRSDTNDMLDAYSKLLLQPLHLHRLIAPNSTERSTPSIQGVLEAIGRNESEPQLTDILSYRTHFRKWKSTKQKDLLGVGATSNTFFALMQDGNMRLNNRIKLNKLSFPITFPLLTPAQQQQLYNAKTKTWDISQPFVMGRSMEKLEYINEFINLTVDASSDDRFGRTNVRRENAGFFLYQIMMGVDFSSVLSFLSQPIIYQYHQKLSVYKLKYTSSDARFLALLDLIGAKDEQGLDVTEWARIQIEQDGEFAPGARAAVWRSIAFYEQGQGKLKHFSPDYLQKGILPLNEVTSAPVTQKAKELLAYYMIGLEQGEALREAQAYLRFDTRPPLSLMKALALEQNAEDIKEKKMFPIDLIQNLRKDSVISHLDISGDYRKLTPQIFSIMRDPIFTTPIVNLGKEISSIDKEERFYQVASNDFLLAIIQTFDGRLDKVKSLLDGGRLMSRWESIKTKIDSPLVDKLVPSFSTNTNLVNPRLWLGFDNAAEDLNNVAEEIRKLLKSPNEEVRTFAEDLVLVGLYQSGFAKSPVYFTDALPYEVVEPILKASYDKYLALENKEDFIDRFIDALIVERARQFGSDFKRIYKDRKINRKELYESLAPLEPYRLAYYDLNQTFVPTEPPFVQSREDFEADARKAAKKAAKKDAFEMLAIRRGDLTVREDRIADFFERGGKVSPESFRRNLDKNLQTERLNYIKKGGRSIDDLAQEMSEEQVGFTQTVTVEDITDFIRTYKSPTAYWNSIQEQIQNALEAEYVSEPPRSVTRKRVVKSSANNPSPDNKDCIPF
jgi:hypothetical protein